jgi:periplasmic protein TonB
VVRLKISPSGEVVDCRVVSSELKTPELESKLVARIRQFEFTSKDVEVMEVTWPVDFLPS